MEQDKSPIKCDPVKRDQYNAVLEHYRAYPDFPEEFLFLSHLAPKLTFDEVADAIRTGRAAAKEIPQPPLVDKKL